ncbi:dystrobrevin beta-like protein [Dinothrombium tinctorium]|uniref:Dystrobrevin beta-like protein n=1 Tax=Dinothrombium tinctorium TaxID=1965070 RepID=A0A3S3NYW6_9ACAR|nr:dystrobrevin beta-like protein [Dinothrombium tinctorium]
MFIPFLTIKNFAVYLVDIWNAIEAIRENGLHTYQDTYSEVSLSKVETLVTSIYYQLNKRLPPSQHINIDESINSFLAFLASTYDPNNLGKIRVFSVKIAFATLCYGKLSDKLKYIYSLISDQTNGHLIQSRFNSFLREVLALACSVFESGSYQYDESLSSTIFDFNHSVTMNMFMNLFFTNGGCPPCLSWFIILSKMAEVENVVHYTQCDACHRQSFVGFRYKCQKCFNYTMCQDCFWRGRVSGSHNADTHPCKEYTYWKSPSKQLGRTLRKSFRCIPSSKGSHIEFSEEVPKSRRLNLSHIVPPSPIPGIHQHYNGLPAAGLSYSSDLESSCLNRQLSFTKSPPISTNFSYDSRISPGYSADEEHRLIARYAAKLASHKKLTEDVPDSALSPQSTLIDISQQQQVISQLESKNREIMREIARLRQEQREYEPENKLPNTPQQDPLLLAELASLRQRKDELEGHLSALHESRRELLVQLEGLMKLLKKHGNLLSAPSSATSTLNRHTGTNVYNTLSSTASTHSDMSSVASGASISSAASVNRDLLVAADSVTNAMSSLVKELNSEDEAILDEIELAKDLSNQLKLNEYKKPDVNLTAAETIDEENKLNFGSTEAELKLPIVSTPLSTPTTTTYVTTDDDESYIKTDEDELEDVEDENFWSKTINIT